MIVCRDLTVRFGEKIVLDGLNLSIPDAGVVCIMGESGRGKTTLLRVLAGLLKPNSGTVEGLSHRKVSVAFQEPRLLGWRTAQDNIASVSDVATASALCIELHLEDVREQRAATLSGGQMQRVSLARAFAFGTDVVLLDEPFAGLDEENKARVLALIHRATLAIVVTHDARDPELLQAQQTIAL